MQEENVLIFRQTNKISLNGINFLSVSVHQIKKRGKKKDHSQEFMTEEIFFHLFRTLL